MRSFSELINVTRSLLLFAIVSFSSVAFGQFSVRDFGAKGDGLALDTKAIQRAIDKAHAAGGGVVNFTPGTYKVGSLFLKDNVEVHLGAGSTLLGSADIKDYTAAGQKYESRTKELYARFFMIFAEGARNISITGQGIIDGNGLKHFQETRPQNLRPFMIRLVDCTNVIIRDVQLLEAANWTLHLLGCEDVKVQGIVIRNNGEGNRDGLDIDACLNVNVSDCVISATDDAIVLKASNDVICRDVTITNCILSSNGSAIKTGTESNGGFKNIVVSNCVVKDIPVHAAIELMTVDGGMMQNILLENIVMENVATPVFIRTGIRARPFKPEQYVKAIQDVQDISLSNITVMNARLPSSIMGLHNRPIRNVSISNYSVRYNDTQAAVANNEVPFEEFSYPMAIMFKELPAYGLYCRNVDGLRLENMRMFSVPEEKRDALAFDRLKDLQLVSAVADVSDGAVLAHFRNTTNASARFCGTTGGSKVMFETEENTVAGVRFTDNLLRDGQREVARVPQLPDGASYEDFPAVMKFSVQSGDVLYDLPFKSLRQPLTVSADIKGRELQLCLLIRNERSVPEKVFVKFNGIIQEFLVDWKEWGWAPVSLMGVKSGQRVSFEIYSPNPDSSLNISKVYLRQHDVGFTD